MIVSIHQASVPRFVNTGETVSTMNKLFALVLSIAASCLPQFALADSASLLLQARAASPERMQYVTDQGGEIVPTSDNKSFYLWWAPPGIRNPVVTIVKLHGHESYAHEGFFLLQPYAAQRGYAVLALQWWFGSGNATADYYTPSNIYSIVAEVLNARGTAPGSVLFHGFSRGSTQTYAVAALDSFFATRYFGMMMSNAGGMISTYPPNLEITRGTYGATPYAGYKWSMYCGELDPDPEESGCPGMTRSRDFVTQYGASMSVFIQDPNGSHGSFDQNSTYVNQLLDAFRPSNPYADAERVLNWAEAAFATLFRPAATSRAGFGYWYRCYAQTGRCLGIKLPDIYYFDGRAINRVGTVNDFLPQARAAGF
jgi:hypothetical protein